MSGAPTSHRNNFGLLQLVFAMCVLVSHSIELVDGNRSREPLTALFGTLSLGEFGVDGFFLVSGYLITQSLQNSASTLSYLWKRVLRIYPAFIVAFVLSIVIVGPLAGADMSALKGVGWVKQLAHVLFLAEPRLPNAFAGLPYPSLNGSMWTIPYEFGCYVLIGFLGLLGMLRRKTMFGISAIALLLVSAFLPVGSSATTMLTNFAGYLPPALQFAAIYLIGAAFYIYRGTISYRNDLALLAAILLVGSLFNHATEELAMPTLGGYLIFWIAFLKNTPKLNRVNNSTDASYGIYLYAWPVQNLLIKFLPATSPIIVMVLTTMAATTLALLSWHFIEKPSLALKRSSGRRAEQLSRADPIRQIGFKSVSGDVDV